MNEINNMIPQALAAVRKHLLSNGSIQKEYNGYIASFGASIKQSGLPITVAMFARADRKSDGASKELILKCIFDVVNNQPITSMNATNLLEFFEKNNSGTPYINNRIEQAAIAIKLALRTFPQSKN